MWVLPGVPKIGHPEVGASVGSALGRRRLPIGRARLRRLSRFARGPLADRPGAARSGAALAPLARAPLARAPLGRRPLGRLWLARRLLGRRLGGVVGSAGCRGRVLTSGSHTCLSRRGGRLAAGGRAPGRRGGRSHQFGWAGAGRGPRGRVGQTSLALPMTPLSARSGGPRQCARPSRPGTATTRPGRRGLRAARAGSRRGEGRPRATGKYTRRAFSETCCGSSSSRKRPTSSRRCFLPRRSQAGRQPRMFRSGPQSMVWAVELVGPADIVGSAGGFWSRVESCSVS